MASRSAQAGFPARFRRYTPAMKNHRIAALVIALSMFVLLAACGNKGELVKPDKPADAPAVKS